MVEFDTTFGLYYQVCKYVGKFDMTKEDVPCKKFGYVQKLEGYIEAEKELTCKLCSELIPNCQICSTSKKCDMCQPGYFETTIVNDARNGTDKVCLKRFCGISGYGSTCNEIPEDSTLKNCRRAEKLQIDKKTSLDTCTQCMPGYYSYAFAFK